MPRITITRRQREPIYGQLRRHLTTIDDICVFADDDPDEAGRLALQFADDFRLFEDVGGIATTRATRFGSPCRPPTCVEC